MCENSGEESNCTKFTFESSLNDRCAKRRFNDIEVRRLSSLIENTNFRSTRSVFALSTRLMVNVFRGMNRRCRAPRGRARIFYFFYFCFLFVSTHSTSRFIFILFLTPLTRQSRETNLAAATTTFARKKTKKTVATNLRDVAPFVRSRKPPNLMRQHISNFNQARMDASEFSRVRLYRFNFVKCIWP